MTGSPSETKETGGNRMRNFIVALVAIALGVSVFLGLQTNSSSASLGKLAETSTPLETATTNGKPTLMEFYANWCSTCQSMAPEMAQLREEYGDDINFVMLNVDNNKWMPEMTEYQVDGIPHFVYLDGSGNDVAEAIGEVPRQVMEANLAALLAGEPLPYARTTSGESSQVEAANQQKSVSSTNPRSHSSQSVN
ncbi:thioredoxin family protein [Geitlerinema sp. PCC 9228]|jgi:thiol-disulfide isomerase/thioredoxin|uniref:thioredoxin family protein n=1 Tax=Geitlerinema sp. PCC 9228 TaxID=111611 RepID=UPI0008F9A27C|nr:thioredoxin family protein [Geitlerinema sp. PCC 9228]